MSGLAQGVRVSAALEQRGIVADAWAWRWQPGAKGGTFPDHLALSGVIERDILEFGTLPQGDVNGDYCECYLQTRWRDMRTGRFARSPGA